jgi:hypothetical protein
MLSSVLFSSIIAPFIILAVLQFPAYGLLLGIANVKRGICPLGSGPPNNPSHSHVYVVSFGWREFLLKPLFWSKIARSRVLTWKTISSVGAHRRHIGTKGIELIPMNTENNLLKARFDLNTGRISGLLQLIFSDFDSLRPKGVFQSDGIRADILRSIVVFLHATFEDVLRSHVPKPNKKLSFYSGTDIDKALKQRGIDAGPFRPLYPPLAQMAKRRKQIVHEADLSSRTDTVSDAWGLADDWQLIMWFMAVGAFYYRLRMAVNAATVVERARYQTLWKAMLIHVEFGNQLVAFPEVPRELRREALEHTVITLETIVATLKLDAITATPVLTEDEILIDAPLNAV